MRQLGEEGGVKSSGLMFLPSASSFILVLLVLLLPGLPPSRYFSTATRTLHRAMKLAALSLLIFLSSATSGFALPSTALDTRPPEPRSQFYRLQQRHDHDEEDEGEHAGMSEMSEMNSTVALHLESAHSHGHSHAAPLLEINETQVLLTHNPDPPSYWDYDQTEEGKPAVLYIHIALMCLAFFILLPLGTCSSSRGILEAVSRRAETES